MKYSSSDTNDSPSAAVARGCELPHRIASVAGVSGGMGYFLLDSCEPERPISILKIFGTNDPIIPFEGNAAHPPVSETLSFFSWYNGCREEPVVTDLPDKVAEDNSTVTRFKYIRCDDRSQVLFYRINGGGHNWPGGGPVPPFLGNQNMDIDASDKILKFFKRNPHPDFDDD